MRTFLPLSVMLLLSLAACAPAATTGTPAQTPASEAEVRAVAEQYAAAHNRDDAAAVAALFAPNGVFITSSSRFEGRAAVQQLHAQSVPSQADLSLSTTRTRVSGDLAVNEGTASFTQTHESGQRVRVVGDYVSVLARQPDGTWKIQTLMTSHVRQTPAQ